MVDYSAYHWAKKAQYWAESIGHALVYRGSVDTYADLPSTGQKIGDMWNVLSDGSNYAWDGTGWDALSGIVDLSAYRTSADQDIIDAKKLENNSTGTSSLSLLGAATVDSSATCIGVDSTAGTNGTSLGRSANSVNGGLAIGTNSKASGSWSTAIGNGNSLSNTAEATASGAIAIGHKAHATGTNAIQIFEGTNSTADSLQVKTYQMLDTSTGLIPDARISTNIARTTSIPTNYVTTDTAQTITQDKAFSGTLVVADNVGLASGTMLSNKKILQKTASGIEVGNSTEDVLLVGKSTTTRPKYNGNDLALLSDAGGLPSQTGQSGKFLTTDGTDASWATVDALPSQTGNNGKYLTTNGSSASWSTVVIPSDNSTQYKVWSGTKAQYDLLTPDANTIYNITDDDTQATFANTDLSNLSATGQALFTAKLDANKIQYVNTLPVSPVAGTLYLIPE